eukprot:5103272-Pyramimonas_sp.AAC.1
MCIRDRGAFMHVMSQISQALMAGDLPGCIRDATAMSKDMQHGCQREKSTKQNLHEPKATKPLEIVVGVIPNAITMVAKLANRMRSVRVNPKALAIVLANVDPIAQMA